MTAQSLGLPAGYNYLALPTSSARNTYTRDALRGTAATRRD